MRKGEREKTQGGQQGARTVSKTGKKNRIRRKSRKAGPEARVSPCPKGPFQRNAAPQQKLTLLLPSHRIM
eukprot:312438-Chlamydomonas_euryale.AAC.1